MADDSVSHARLAPSYTARRRRRIFCASLMVSGCRPLIETCKINGVEPFAYLKATLTAIAKGHPQSRIDDLLSWSFKPSS